jgi:hypothetical protein
LLGPAEGFRPVSTLLYAMGGRQEIPILPAPVIREKSQFRAQDCRPCPLVPLLFLTQIAGARLRPGQHKLAITCFYARSDAVSVLVIRAGGSLQAVVEMFTDVLRTSACCVSCWRGDQQSGQYGHAKHKSGQAGLTEVGEGYATQQQYRFMSARPRRRRACRAARPGHLVNSEDDFCGHESRISHPCTVHLLLG